MKHIKEHCSLSHRGVYIRRILPITKVSWMLCIQFNHESAYEICKELADLKDRKEMDLAGELDEMIALGWTDEEAKDNPEAFLDRIGEEYKEGLTEEDIWRVWKNVLEIEEEATAKEFDDYGKLKYINPEAYYEEGWSIAGQAEDEDGDAYDIVLSADKTEYRYTSI